MIWPIGIAYTTSKNGSTSAQAIRREIVGSQDAATQVGVVRGIGRSAAVRGGSEAVCAEPSFDR